MNIRIRRMAEADFDWLESDAAPRGGLSVASGLADPVLLQILRPLPANWVAIAGDEVVAILSAKTPLDSDEVEIGYGVAESRRGRGIASAAIAALLAELRELGVHAAIAETSEDNGPSQRVLERNGFERSGGRIDDEDGPMQLWRRDLS